MKKTIIFVTVVLTVALFAGCMGMDSAKTRMQNTADNIKENAQQATDMTKNALDKSKFIGEEKAKEKALEHAGLTTDGTVFEKIDLDQEMGVWEYEVEFRNAGLEYEVDINAETGEVIAFKKEFDD